MSTATRTALKTAYETEVAKISDTLVNAQATDLLDQLMGGLEQQEALEGDKIASYSLMGRSFTRRSVRDGRSAVNAMRRELDQMIYGGATLGDLSA